MISETTTSKILNSADSAAHSQASARAYGLRKAVIASTLGTTIEWYDYALYGAASGLIINRLFFPALSPVTGVLAAFATFAVGFFVRPLGGIVVASIGDRFGRKPALLLTIILMAMATTGMGLLPTYDQIGLLAPVLLVFLRLVQGLGAGAELAGAMTLVAEYAPPEKRAFYTAIPSASTVVGILLAMVAFLAVSNVPEEALLGWAWRIPFLISGLLFLVALYIRHSLDETPAYVEAMKEAAKKKSEAAPLGELLTRSRWEVLFGFLSVTGHNANAYILSAFALSYMTNTLHYARADALTVVIIAAICGIIGTLTFGRLTDRFGSATIYILGAAAVIAISYPMFAMFDSKNMVLATIGMSTTYFVGYGAMAGAQGAFLANLFPTRYRFSGIAISRELNGLAIAGPTPFIAAALVAYADGKPNFVVAYIIICALVTIGSVIAGRKHSKHI
jgi:MHS family shikimate/dehydroshikimate transporter-like MFS transporter